MDLLIAYAPVVLAFALVIGFGRWKARRKGSNGGSDRSGDDE